MASRRRYLDIMERVPEAELMDDGEQALAYARADFAEPHDRFVALLSDRMAGLPPAGVALDLGCGPGDIMMRFARAWPDWSVDGIDGAAAMLALGREAVHTAGLERRLAFVEAHMPTTALPRPRYDLVFSNSLLHHLAEPAPFWTWLRERFAGTPLFLMDLMRPESRERARWMVDEYASGEPEVLRTDFFNSLCAAYTPGEVEAQLRAAGLGGFRIEVVSDRHLIAHGGI